jgi:hypothetical protein
MDPSFFSQLGRRQAGAMRWLSRSCDMIRIAGHTGCVELNLFEDRETAKYVLETFLKINDQMDESIRAVENRVSPEEYKAFKARRRPCDIRSL